MAMRLGLIYIDFQELTLLDKTHYLAYTPCVGRRCKSHIPSSILLPSSLREMLFFSL